MSAFWYVWIVWLRNLKKNSWWLGICKSNKVGRTMIILHICAAWGANSRKERCKGEGMWAQLWFIRWKEDAGGAECWIPGSHCTHGSTSSLHFWPPHRPPSQLCPLRPPPFLLDNCSTLSELMQSEDGDGGGSSIKSRSRFQHKVFLPPLYHFEGK